jgi:hypothetical protein
MDSFSKFASVRNIDDVFGSTTSKTKLNESKTELVDKSEHERIPSSSMTDFTTKSNESLSNSVFHLAAESNLPSTDSMTKLSASRSKSKSKIVLKSKVTTQVSSVTGTKLASTGESTTSINDQTEDVDTLYMPRFDYKGNVCSQTGRTTIGAEKLALKNLVLTLFQVQIRDMFVAKEASNESESDTRAEAQQEETLGHMICSIALMAIEEMIISSTYYPSLTLLVLPKRL